MDQIESNDNNSDLFDENALLEKDEQYYFSKEQFYSPVKKGVVELDEKVFKIYT